MALVRPEIGGKRQSESISDLFEALESPLLGYAMRLVSDVEMAQDIVQEAFMKLHQQSQEVREPRSWLYRTVHNLAANQLRKESRLVKLPVAAEGEGAQGGQAGDPVDLQPLPDEQIARWEGVGLVRLGMASLDARSRELLRLKFHEGLSYKEIGTKTGLSVGNVGFLLHHSLKALAAELQKAGLVP